MVETVRILAIDTETTGLPIRGLPSVDPRQPRIVQFAAILTDETRREYGCASFIVDAGVPVPDGAAKVHGITTEMVKRFGVPEKLAVGSFVRLVAVADLIVAHNLTFDLDMVDGTAGRLGIRWKVPSGGGRCTMNAASPILNLPPTARMVDAGFGDKPKPPKLEEAYELLIGKKLEGAHDALVDVRACIDVYFALLERGAWKEAA
jgi:DNA polymerase-3 subunit epsilon